MQRRAKGRVPRPKAVPCGAELVAATGVFRADAPMEFADAFWDRAYLLAGSECAVQRTRGPPERQCRAAAAKARLACAVAARFEAASDRDGGEYAPFGQGDTGGACR